MNKRILEIRARKEEIRKALQGNEKVDIKALQEELRKLDEEQKRIEEREKLAASINMGADPEGVTIRSKPAPAVQNKGLDSEEYRHAFMEYVTRGKAIPAEFRSATTTTDAGAIIPPTTLNKIIDKIRTYGNILPKVTRTSYKSGLAIPYSDVKPKAVWVAEGATSEKQKKTLGTITFSHYKLRCAVSVTLETEQMSLSAFEAALVDNVAEAMAVALEEAIIKGDGTTMPTGIIHDITKAQTLAVKKIDYKTLTTAEGKLPQAYEAGAFWFMTKKTFMEFVSMVDSAGQPIARTDYGINGIPARTLLGRSVVLCDYLPDFSETLKTNEPFAFIFKPKDYVLNTNYSVSMKVYEDNDTDDIVRKSIMIADGKVVDAGSLVVLTGSVAG